jgi:hypothetical protein
MEVPLELGARWIKYLNAKDIKNMHLVCKKFDEIANLYPHKLHFQDGFDFNFKKQWKEQMNLQFSMLKASKRIYAKVEKDALMSGDWNILNRSENVEAILQLFANTGIHIRKLNLVCLNMKKSTLLRILLLLPNLQSLSLKRVKLPEKEDKSADYEIALSKLEEFIILDIESHLVDTLLKSLKTSALERFSIKARWFFRASFPKGAQQKN